MKKLHHSALLLLVGLGLASACSGDDDSDNPGSAAKGGSSGKGGTAGKSGSAGKGGSSGDAGDGAGGSTGGKGGSAGKGGKGGSAGKGGSTGGTGNPEGGSSGSPEGGTNAEGGTGDVPSTGGTAGTGNTEPCVIYDDDRETAEIPLDDEGNVDFGSEDEMTLTHDKTWILNGRAYVPPGKTLNIEACTLIEGTRKPNAGTLFVMRGAKLNAIGEKDRPIVFSSDDQQFHSSEPWGGIVLLGNAIIGPALDAELGTQEKIFEGMTDDRATYGGNDNEDSSGTLKYIRIEYGGDIIAADKEVNGLSFGGVGHGTVVDHIMVKRQADDCFEWFGGTVDADHLICQDSGDDMFDTDLDFRGHLQFLFGRISQFGTSADPNGFEWDGNQDNQTGTEEAGIPQAANATLCGIGTDTGTVARGAVLRRRLQPGTSIINTIVTGFDVGVDTRDVVGTNDDPFISWTHSLFFGNFGKLVDTGNPEYSDNYAVPDEVDNDTAFDEVAWLKDPANNNDNGDGNATLAGVAPAGFDCSANPPHPFPDAMVEGGTPGEGFDTSANYVGAFKDADDNWMTGLWVNWD
jgi:hypothetical protein